MSTNDSLNETPSSENEIELSVLWRGIRRRLPIILLSTALLAGLTYVWSKRQPPVFQSSASMVTVAQNNVTSGNGTLVAASTLPAGALDEALQSSLVINKVVAGLKQSQLASSVKSEVTHNLQHELQLGKLATLVLNAKLDYNNNGIYTVTAKGPTAQAARILADGATQALLDWDKGRALGSIEQAIKVQKAQLQQIDQQLKAPGLEAVERETLVATRALTQRNLANTTIQAQAVTGSITSVSPAIEPLIPVAPKPTRNAVLVGLLTLLLGGAIAALLTIMDRTIKSEDDLLALGIPTLGSIPRLKKRDIMMSGFVRAARQAGLYEAIGFLRVNLMSALAARNGRLVMISSTAPGEGKSSLTATLADGFASSGQKVLIIDADLRRGTQAEVWRKYDQGQQWVPLMGQPGGARTVQDALRNPQNVEVLRVEQNVDILPAGTGIHDSLGMVNRLDLGTIFQEWGKNYDLVLIDSPPLLALADGLVLGGHVDGVIVVVDAGQTTAQAVQQVIRRTKNVNVPVLGAVLNKVNVADSQQESYNYSYAPKQSGRL